MAAVAEYPIAKVGDEGHGDLVLSPQEAAGEAAEAAANRERELGGNAEAVQDAYDRAYKGALEEGQAQLDGESAAGEAGGAMSPVEEPGSTGVLPEKLAVTGPSASKRKWNGKAPNTTWLTLKSVKIEVPEGDFKKGERFTFEGEAVVVSEAVKDRLDKDTMTAVEASQLHDAVVIDFALTDGMAG